MCLGNFVPRTYIKLMKIVASGLKQDSRCIHTVSLFQCSPVSFLKDYQPAVRSAATLVGKWGWSVALRSPLYLFLSTPPPPSLPPSLPPNSLHPATHSSHPLLEWCICMEITGPHYLRQFSRLVSITLFFFFFLPLCIFIYLSRTSTPHPRGFLKCKREREESSVI